ncbi:S-layer homology domain-containing protein [Candidatus Peregrinibacteria bacterium]|nr:S-layer homology domain-containing protein [Candidatus Peregrinibacteria bacterium]
MKIYSSLFHKILIVLVGFSFLLFFIPNVISAEQLFSDVKISTLHKNALKTKKSSGEFLIYFQSSEMASGGHESIKILWRMYMGNLDFDGYALYLQEKGVNLPLDSSSTLQFFPRSEEFGYPCNYEVCSFKVDKKNENGKLVPLKPDVVYEIKVWLYKGEEFFPFSEEDRNSSVFFQYTYVPEFDSRTMKDDGPPSYSNVQIKYYGEAKVSYNDNFLGGIYEADLSSGFLPNFEASWDMYKGGKDFQGYAVYVGEKELPEHISLDTVQIVSYLQEDTYRPEYTVVCNRKEKRCNLIGLAPYSTLVAYSGGENKQLKLHTPYSVKVWLYKNAGPRFVEFFPFSEEDRESNTVFELRDTSGVYKNLPNGPQPPSTIIAPFPETYNPTQLPPGANSPGTNPHEESFPPTIPYDPKPYDPIPSCTPPAENGTNESLLTKGEAIPILKSRFLARYGESYICTPDVPNQLCFQNSSQGGKDREPDTSESFWEASQHIYNYYYYFYITNPDASEENVSIDNALRYVTALFKLPLVYSKEDQRIEKYHFHAALLEDWLQSARINSLLFYSPSLFEQAMKEEVPFDMESCISQAQFLSWIDFLKEGEKSGFHRSESCKESTFYEIVAGRCKAFTGDGCREPFTNPEALGYEQCRRKEEEEYLPEKVLKQGFQCDKEMVVWELTNTLQCKEAHDGRKIPVCFQYALYATPTANLFPSEEKCIEFRNQKIRPIPLGNYKDPVLKSFDMFTKPFPDINIQTQEGKAVAELYRRNVIKGINGKFHGDVYVNRAQAIKMLLITRYGLIKKISNTTQFPDIKNDEWYVRYIVMGLEKGIIKGYDDGYFRPENLINTAEFLKMFTTAFSLQGEENLPYSYTDVQETDWFAKYAGIAQKYEMFPYQKTELFPHQNLSRQDIATAIYQYLAHINNWQEENFDVRSTGDL